MSQDTTVIDVVFQLSLTVYFISYLDILQYLYMYNSMYLYY